MKSITLTILCTFLILNLGCHVSPKLDEPVNKNASLPAEFNFSSKRLRVISSIINKTKGTMSTLYGNDIAIDAAKSGNQKNTPGIELTLITWQQKPNKYWFGNNIPGKLLTIETVEANQITAKVSYKCFNEHNQSLILNPADTDSRIAFILTQKPSVMP